MERKETPRNPPIPAGQGTQNRLKCRSQTQERNAEKMWQEISKEKK